LKELQFQLIAILLLIHVIKARFYNQSTANIKIEREMELYYNTLVSVSQQNQIISDCSLIPTDCLFFNSDECLFCQTGSFLNSNTGICVLTCPDGYFGNSTTNTCDVCAEKCATCTSLTNGLTPKLGKVIYQGICLDTCPNGTFAVDGVCQICTSNCLTCADSTTCSVCQTGYLLNGLCFDSCPTGYYIITSPNNQCGACEANCDQCTDSTTCTKCSATYYLYNADCYSVCPDGTYKCDVNNTCKDCPAECATCSDKNTCTYLVKQDSP
jgi:proprotein convertase subtilisin/kexin type 5